MNSLAATKDRRCNDKAQTDRGKGEVELQENVQDTHRWRLTSCGQYSSLAPTNEDGSFAMWWQFGSQRVGSEARKGFNSIVLLGAWSLWKHRNTCVFDGASPSLDRVLLLAKEEAQFWSLAGARGISSLTALQQG
ncbi:hypothetical protein U9M48_014190 [Paspalum notatum var. saurae]|uniref:Uncharacterized protein n=1 Tax=Paspalum notatum var. saurae TaxID=547442 RepID=A0AAQ3T147_PASNO